MFLSRTLKRVSGWQRFSASLRYVALSHGSRHYSTEPNFVRIVEVGPRDGLQNEPQPIPPPVKAELIDRLGQAGLRNIEAGSFVSPKWVPQMAGTAEVLSLINPIPNTELSVLVPNGKGLDDVFRVLSAPISPKFVASLPPPITEIAIFAAATNAFSRANTNVTISESLARLEPVARAARAKGLRVRGYISVIITCPYSGRVDPRMVRDVSRELLQMGCYEVSLGDTTGTGTPASVRAVLEEVCKETDPSSLAGHFHDTNGTALANIFMALDMGLRSFDASVGGLGGCPYSPGATGNVATEDVVYSLVGESFYSDIGEPYPELLRAPPSSIGSKWDVGPISLPLLAETGAWISEIIGRESTSRAGRAYLARKRREQKLTEKAQAKGKL